MRAQSFNDGWQFRRLALEGEKNAPLEDVTLPHDAMIGEKRSPQAVSAQNSGWFEGRDYEYTKTWVPPEELAGKSLVLEFEGVYHLAEVWVNDALVAERPFGYTNFYVDLDGLAEPGRPCELRVVARNSDQPNSRWYSGAGIYRPVTLWVGERVRLLPNGIAVRTLSLDGSCASVRVALRASDTGLATVELLPEDSSEPVAAGSVELGADGTGALTLEVPQPRVWSPEHPDLYRCSVALASEDGRIDHAETLCGIRTLEWGDDGLLLNGNRIVLRGACVHHNNGVLGACAYADAEWRKVLLMREQGYNTLRSAHNPCSKALLDACDHLGVLVMDEYVDHWYIHKTLHDYVEHFDAWWRKDLEDMVEKDRNHPSVVLYSIGNEVAETAQERGVLLTRQMVKRLHALDPTRPVTCGVNIFFNLLSSLGLGQYSDEKARREAERAARQDVAPHRAVGSEFYNRLAGLLGAGFMKKGAALPACDRVTRDAFAQMDVAGYNYGIDCYKHDLRAYPHRLILGSETFCSDAQRFSEFAEREPRLIGDFVWAGMDYLGETGVGSWEYKDYAPRESGFGWLTAGSGRVDLTGKPLGEALYTRVALAGEAGPYLAVCPVNHTGERHSPSAWKMSNAIESWSWDDCEGRVANVEVYAHAHEVTLLLNGREVGRRRLRGSCVARMSCRFEPGMLEAVAFDEDGRELRRHALRSAEGPTELRAEVEYAGVPGGFVRRDVWHGGADEKVVGVGAGRLAFVRVRYTGAEGETRPLARGVLKASLKGGDLLGFGCASPFNEGSFVTGEAQTYFGEALAVVRPTPDSSGVRLSVTDGTLSATLEVPVIR
ncbi:glycoside hydrolase family 2 TIM barrel-domain containing protein [Olsenella sp. Marseille-P4559]|uniref:glycoside hydrolase family 2 TIM barrel-domain containing protein n=1 Tax=Olsenella sp. Marseille-P4559 TaxID=2364795 RepID=UPI001032032B|nr:glycoside hydrolase family 2 TIM barrel-domain containing protein [Olsenella sp. Marseille-P4559]